jgi:hypothetical protein
MRRGASKYHFIDLVSTMVSKQPSQCFRVGMPTVPGYPTRTYVEPPARQMLDDFKNRWDTSRKKAWNCIEQSFVPLFCKSLKSLISRSPVGTASKTAFLELGAADPIAGETLGKHASAVATRMIAAGASVVASCLVCNL